jgi:hypothetical protein
MCFRWVAEGSGEPHVGAACVELAEFVDELDQLLVLRIDERQASQKRVVTTLA